jgi:transaldolase
MPAGMRDIYHTTELAGAEIIFSIHPKIQRMILDANPVQEQRIDQPVNPNVIDRLLTISEFKRAYEPEGMKSEEFLSYGLVQRTLTQFVESGWNKLV